jgi:hypothetical protein
MSRCAARGKLALEPAVDGICARFARFAAGPLR